MIEFLSRWAKNLGVVIVIVSIFEMILPNNKTKKYIRVVLGIFVMFNIISPFIKNKDKLSSVSIDLENYTTEQNVTVDQTSMDKRIQDLYEKELEKDGVVYRRHPVLPYAYELTNYDYLAGLLAFQKGYFYIQDISSMQVAEWAEPKEGDYVIDVCAAPGGKAIHLAEKLSGTGYVEARDLT